MRDKSQVALEPPTPSLYVTQGNKPFHCQAKVRRLQLRILSIVNEEEVLWLHIPVHEALKRQLESLG